jgi:hypothetical protein
MNIKEQNSSLYYYLLDCRDIVILKEYNKAVEYSLDKNIKELDRAQLMQLVALATEIRNKQIVELKEE